MWKLIKPELDSAKKDIDVLLAHCRNLDDADGAKLRQLYDEYDDGKGLVTKRQLQPLASKSAIIREQYKKTYDKEKSNDLYYIRKELMAKVQKCPYCSINEPSQLDHYMDKSTYGQLATCRLNLVPLCSICNWRKSDKVYDDFVHPYYQDFPQYPFLMADCRVVNDMAVFSFRIDSTRIEDVALRSRLKSQMINLNLRDRLRKAAQEYMNDIFMYNSVSTDGELKCLLDKILSKNTRLYGLNDWRTAVVRGLMDCHQFDMKVVNMINAKVRPINGTGA